MTQLEAKLKEKIKDDSIIESIKKGEVLNDAQVEELRKSKVLTNAQLEGLISTKQLTAEQAISIYRARGGHNEKLTAEWIFTTPRHYIA